MLAWIPGAGAGKVLRPGGLLLVYGPFKVDGKCTTESNASFDASLRRQNPEWGYRCDTRLPLRVPRQLHHPPHGMHADFPPLQLPAAMPCGSAQATRVLPPSPASADAPNTPRPGAVLQKRHCFNFAPQQLHTSLFSAGVHLLIGAHPEQRFPTARVAVG